MNSQHEGDLVPGTTDEAITDQVQKLRSELEQLGRWGIVTWCDEDIATALEDAGADTSRENVKAVREHLQVGQIDDRMTEIGFQILAEAIHDLGLAGGGATDKRKRVTE
jgi:hypothetical protein